MNYITPKPGKQNCQNCIWIAALIISPSPLPSLPGLLPPECLEAFHNHIDNIDNHHHFLACLLDNPQISLPFFPSLLYLSKQLTFFIRAIISRVPHISTHRHFLPVFLLSSILFVFIRNLFWVPESLILGDVSKCIKPLALSGTQVSHIWWWWGFWSFPLLFYLDLLKCW